ncbi:hypothetical protein EI171_26080 [Bradyrhizobium sp. LCT2]|uniref:hypothetical protein n=1 Tax=Bradyrhizobium sp. LCT2 TaxID=2493093 RepID=UPI0013743FF8|nr:hypothetical protein [Bradyrhizobium sp. LCT2]QHP70453.1 hypothetical protein EI171_26080 [Bradyrhizobium sp. LCT2]
MSLPKDIETRRYSLNSGSPVEVVGLAGSGTLWADVLINGIIPQIYAGTSGGQPAYVTSFYASTTDGPISPTTKSPEQAQFEAKKARLTEAIRSMKKSAPNWNGSSTRVNEMSALSAEKFLDCLPGKTPLPKVAPDGEGDVMFVWDDPGKPKCVLTVEKRALHLACGLGTADVKHVDDQRFLGVRIPQPILELLPSK